MGPDDETNTEETTAETPATAEADETPAERATGDDDAKDES